ncbi:uncharacterized protein EI90DRAFT_192441 [Cantharellus anzutake]|uniref:uncharacterized protein n=1 Tax=Cantharellus anzutake TaxID=1750568 RepID=UPI0019032CE8|nr:uncharacterized protein EI90DRAFT_192441 [Cantharellus anzutake]KAF8336571.1 hypothetical protein EI90DRAFT_192441 [Cantharellus anzutake]
MLRRRLYPFILAYMILCTTCYCTSLLPLTSCSRMQRISAGRATSACGKRGSYNICMFNGEEEVMTLCEKPAAQGSQCTIDRNTAQCGERIPAYSWCSPAAAAHSVVLHGYPWAEPQEDKMLYEADQLPRTGRSSNTLPAAG